VVEGRVRREGDGPVVRPAAAHRLGRHDARLVHASRGALAVAEIYAWADDEYFAKLPGVRAELARVAKQGGARAEAILAAHHHEGHARIVVDSGVLDWYVALDDTRGLQAALWIEFGRGPAGWHRAPAQGILALPRASGRPASRWTTSTSCRRC